MSETPEFFAAMIPGRPAPILGSRAEAEAAALKLAKENIGYPVWVVQAVETVRAGIAINRTRLDGKDADSPAPFNFFGM